jgi:hypothetical protein
MTRVRYSKLMDFVCGSRGAYTVEEKGDQLVISFNPQLESVKEHYEDATIRIYAKKTGVYAEVYDAEMDYGGENLRKMNVDSLAPWLMTIDDESVL